MGNLLLGVAFLIYMSFLTAAVLIFTYKESRAQDKEKEAAAKRAVELRRLEVEKYKAMCEAGTWKYEAVSKEDQQNTSMT